MTRKFNQVGIVGVGLIGGAVGQAVRRAGLAGRVFGCCRRAEAGRAAVAAGAVDECSADPARAAAGSDLVILATGPESIPAMAGRVAAALPAGAIVTDVASVKSRVVAGCTEALGGRGRFVGSHPLAGSERRGVEHAAEVVLAGAVCAVTPVRSTDAAARAEVCAFWTALGLRVVELSPEEHDARLARTSHLPHLTAAALCALTQEGDADFCASGFRDCTRVAAGDPGMWAQIALGNREALAAELYRLARRLQGAADTLTAADREELLRLLETGAARRREMMRE